MGMFLFPVHSHTSGQTLSYSVNTGFPTHWTRKEDCVNSSHPGVLLVQVSATDVPSQPKVSDLEHKALSYEDIPGSQVTVDNLWQKRGREWSVAGTQYGFPRKGDTWWPAAT